MFDFKKKLAERKAKNRVFEQAQKWKRNALLQDCLGVLRGTCTVAGPDHREAVEAAVFLAQTEGSWRQIESILEDLPEGWLTGPVFILWDEATLPVLRCDGQLVLENINDVTAVASETFLVSEMMERIIHFGHGKIRLYSNSPEELA